MKQLPGMPQPTDLFGPGESKIAQKLGGRGFDEAKHPRDDAGKFAESASNAIPQPLAKNTKLGGTGDLVKQGFKPKRRAGNTATDALVVAWAHAIATKKPAVAVMGGRGWEILRPGDRVAHAQPHMVVSPEGKVHRFDPHLGDE